MSRPGRSSRAIGNRPPPRARIPTPTVNVKRPIVGAGDNAPRVDLDAELFSVLQKHYDEGEEGEMEAIDDAKAVLKEVAQEPIARAMDRAMPRFLSPETAQDGFVLKPKSATRKRSKTPRHAMLTARPQGRGKSRQNQTTEATLSVPNITNGTAETDAMRVTTSEPTFRSTTRQWSSASSSYTSEKTSRTNLKVTGMDETEELPRATTGMSGATDVSGDFAVSTAPGQESDDDELPFTENLLEMPTDTDDIEDVWKSDIVELTKMKSSVPKKEAGFSQQGKTVAGTETLELKYKEPQWPHQLLLNQILIKCPRLTHLILDGSELRYLRDLGSSLQSLITLSICDCGLRSLDGAFALPNLRTLIARKNEIKVPTQCSFLNRLIYLDLSSNPISSFDEFTHLRQCTELRILKLHDTPIANAPKFNKRIKKLVPQLKEVHPPYFDASQLIFLRNEGEQAPEEDGKDTGAKKDRDSMMPSLSFDDVMRSEPKTGLAYQQLPNPKAKWQQQQDPETTTNMGIFMGPKFIKHLEETIPPASAKPGTEEGQKCKVEQKDDDNIMSPRDAHYKKTLEELFRRKN